MQSAFKQTHNVAIKIVKSKQKYKFFTNRNKRNKKEKRTCKYNKEDLEHTV